MISHLKKKPKFCLLLRPLGTLAILGLHSLMAANAGTAPQGLPLGLLSTLINAACWPGRLLRVFHSWSRSSHLFHRGETEAWERQGMMGALPTTAASWICELWEGFSDCCVRTKYPCPTSHQRPAAEAGISWRAPCLGPQPQYTTFFVHLLN